MQATRTLLSVVIPAYNEEASLPELFSRLTQVTAGLPDYDFEFILVDNCSQDGTERMARGFSERDPRWKYVRFSRNFKVETSLTAGLTYASGAAAIFLVSDLQDPPEYLPKMIQTWRNERADVVYGVVRKRRDGNFLKTLGAKLFYQLIYRLSDIRIPANATDFRLISRPVIEALNRCPERNRYLRGLVHWVGFKQVGFEYSRRAREKGESNAGLLTCANLAFSAMIAFSTKPLRWASLLGLAATGFSLVAAGIYTALRILLYFGLNPLTPPPPGWATQMIFMFFFGGIQCLFLGIIGEYVGRVFDEVKQRPLWVVDRTAGFTSGSALAHLDSHRALPAADLSH